MCSHCGRDHSAHFWCDARTLKQYKNLAFSILNQYCRSYHLPIDEIPDFEQHMLTKLIQAPQSYRSNSAGIYTILRHVATKYVRKWMKTEAEVQTGIRRTRLTHEPLGPDVNIDLSQFTDKTDYAERFNRGIDSERVILMLASLPGPERVCLSMLFGVGHPCAYSVYAISKRLRASPDWVERKILRGKVLLKRQLKLDSLTER
jgi:RNA polymerase sigma factor (sigma-70 family)